MGKDAVEFLGGRPKLRAEICRDLRESPHCEREDIVSHKDELRQNRLQLSGHASRRVNRERIFAPPRTRNKVGTFAVRAQNRVRLRLHARRSGRVIIAKHHRARAITKKDATRAVSPIQNAREAFRPNHNRLLIGIEVHEAPRLLKRIYEARARRLQIKCTRVFTAEETLHHTRRRWERIIIRCRSRDYNKPDFLRLHARRRHRRLRGFHRHRRSGLALIRHMARMDSRMGVNPLVARIQGLRDIVICDNTRRQITACT